MKKLTLFFSLLLTFNGIAQEGFMVGINISPTWKVIMSSPKQTGLRTYQSGYGFNAGMPIKYWINDYSAFCSGIEYDFAAFDSYENAILVSSVRYNALHVPLMFNINLSGDWYGLIGGGLMYNLAVRDLNSTIGTDVTAVTNRFQPYLGLGVSTIRSNDYGFFEYGVQVRYQIRNSWDSGYAPLADYNAHLISGDFIFRFFF